MDKTDEVALMICKLFYETDLPSAKIARMAHVRHDTVLDVIARNFTKKFRSSRKSRLLKNQKMGDKNPMWRIGVDHPMYIGEVSDGKGYVLVPKPIWYTGRAGTKHVFKHTIVMCEYLGLSEMPPGFCVHHIDGDTTNNSINNLALMSIGAHSKLHHVMKGATTISKESRD